MKARKVRNSRIMLEWYTASMNTLAPLMGRIEATDGLVDRIVYKLYGLTADEIKIVEASISNHKDSNTTEDKKI